MRVAFTGHRPEQLHIGHNELSEEGQALRDFIRNEIRVLEQAGADTFFCGAARGADIICGELVMQEKQAHPELKLICVIPFAEQARGWAMNWAFRYRELLRNADALLQKTFTVDFLQKKKKANEGEVPQYYVENSHPAIVTEEVFDLVQHELRRRQQKGRHTSAASIFSNRIVCGECGAYYGSKVWHSTDAYRSRIWRCNRKYETKGSPCPSPHLREAELQNAFLKAINQVIQKKEEIIEACSQALRTLNDTRSLEQKAARLQEEQDVVYGKIESLIHENAQVAQDQKEYNRRMEALYARCEELKGSMAKVRSQIMDKAGRSRNIEAYLQKISRTEPLTIFDESVFTGTVDCVIVRKGQGNTEKQLIFRFKDGTEVPITINQCK